MSDETEDNEDAQAIEIALEPIASQQIIQFMGDNLAAAQSNSGSIFIELAAMCKGCMFQIYHASTMPHGSQIVTF